MIPTTAAGRRERTPEDAPMSRRPKRSARPASPTRGHRPSIEALEGRELMTGYTVTTAADAGAGSLRAAILAADSDNQVGADTIQFAIPGGGVQTIAPKSPLPPISRTVVVDGTTQPGYTPGGAPAVVIDGAGVGPGADGFYLTGGGGSVIRGLGIVNFLSGAGGGGGRGILSIDPGKDRFEANYLGVAADGFTAGPNSIGIEVDSPGNTIGGATAAARDLISGNVGAGVSLAGPSATGNMVAGNRIGTDSTGLFSVGNLYGVDLSASGNTIGGTAAGAGNLISGNVGPKGQTGIGILFEGVATTDVVQGNTIGLDLTGKSALANVYGVYFGTPGGSANDTISQDTVGGAVAGAGNAISGNFIGITGNVTASLIAGNIVGLDAPGKAAVPNGYGILLGASGTTIGGTAAGAGNVISGNSMAGADGTGLDLTGDHDLVQGNRVGTDAGGTSAVANAVGMILHVTNSTIGGTAAGAGNIVSGNAGDGIRLDTNGNDAIQGNFVGASPGGAPGNGGNGIDLILAATTPPATAPLALNDTIGGTTFGTGNFLFGNGAAGIAVANTYGPGVNGLAIRSNSIARNAKLGIDLISGGVAFPGYLSLTAASPVAAGKTTVAGVFHGTPGVAYPIDFFASTAADASGFGQGQYFLGTATVTPGGGGLVSFTQTFDAPAIGQPVITATSTDEYGNTSEFSRAFPAPPSTPAADLSITGGVATPAVTIGGFVTYTEKVTNNGTATADNVVLDDGLATSLVNAFATTTAGTVSVSGANVVTASLGSLAPGQSATVTIAANSSLLGTIQNTAGVSSTTLDPNYGNNLATQPVAVVPVVPPTADLGITSVASSGSPQVGAGLTYTVTVRNNGPALATNVTVNDFLPAGATFVRAVPSQGAPASVNGTLVVDNLGTIASGSSATLTVVVTPTAAGPITNAANVSGNQFDPAPGNNSTRLTLTAQGVERIALGLTQAASPTVGTPGRAQVFTLTVTNAGPDAATGVTLVDSLPTGAAYSASSASQGGQPTVANGYLNHNFGTIAAGGSATVTLVVIPTAAGTIVNLAGVVAAGAPATPPVFSTVSAVVAGGPSVIGVDGTRANGQLVASFSEPLNATTATNKANYRLYDLGTAPRAITAADRPLLIPSVAYIPQANRVVFTPSKALTSTHYYDLVIVGSTAAGIADTSGRKLIGVAGSLPQV